MHSCGTSLCSLDINKPKVNTGMDSASNKDQNIPVQALSLSCHVGFVRKLSGTGNPWDEPGALPPQVPVLFVGGCRRSCGSSHTHIGGLTMGLRKLCPVRAASVCAAEALM